MRDPSFRFPWSPICLSWSVLIVVVCTIPWFVGQPQWWRVNWVPFSDALHSKRRLLDAVVNFLLYVPLGFAYVKARSSSKPRVIVEAGCVAALLAVGCEFYQVFSPVRFPSMTDVVSNAAGAFMGGFIGRRCGRSCNSRDNDRRMLSKQSQVIDMTNQLRATGGDPPLE